VIGVSQNLKLSQLSIGAAGVVTELKVNGLMRRRLLDLGLVENTLVKVVRKSPIGEPVAYEIKGTLIALRREDAEKILVKLTVPSTITKGVS